MRERDHTAMNAAGWHICLDVLDTALAGTAVGAFGRPGCRTA